MSSEPLDRRTFFRAGLRHFARALRDPRPLRRLRPPGALPEAEFLRACTRCDECVRVCPAQCIVHVPEGYADAGTPLIAPDSRACVLCSSLACTHVCEPAALRPLQAPAEVRIGLALVDRGACVAFQGVFCPICRDVCPTAPKAIELDGGRPRVRADLCTGCGLCEERCPTRPRAVRVMLLDAVRGA
ncbi:MAG: 4Fe-4S dicluster domain-containing protein [Planctomycetota bacterium]|nr:MAG: 4Fe-4S dicluster domain-containing protein [Planctomycetota bacterium]